MTTSLDRRETVMARTGLPGHGKSWSLARYIVDVWIPEHEGAIFTNVPLKIEAIADHFAKLAPKAKREEVRERVRRRVVLIPSEVDQAWLDGTSNPREYFAALAGQGRGAEHEQFDDEQGDDDEGDDNQVEAVVEPYQPLRRALVVIDEAGKMWPAMATKDRKCQVDAVKAWIATLRHQGARVCFVCQDLMQLDAGIRRLCAVELRCTKMNTQTEPITGAQIDDWCQLVAKLTWGWWYPVWLREIEVYKEDRSEVEGRVTSGFMWSKYFAYYDSHNNPGEASGAEEQPQYIRFGLLRFFLWLIGRNAFSWGWRVSVGAALFVIFAPPFSLGPKAAMGAINKAMEVANGSGGQLAAFGASGGGTPGEVRAQVGTVTPGAARSQLEILSGELAAERQARADLEQQLGRASGVVGIVGHHVLMGDGAELKEGQAYVDGPYKGRTVRWIDARGRAVHLDNGIVLRMPLGKAAAKPDPEQQGKSGVAERVGAPQGGGDKAAGGGARKTDRLGREGSDARKPGASPGG